MINILPKSPLDKTGWPWTKQVSIDVYQNKSDWPKITIVTPSYNQGAYIEETIRSVILQNYPNLEYMIIDGGSTDNTVEIIKKYESWISYWVSEPDKGQSDAIRKSLSRATGKIFNWLNSDDYYSENALYNVANMFGDNTNMVCGTTMIFDDKGTQKKGEATFRQNDSIRSILCSPDINQPATFFKTEVYHSLNGISTDLHYIMDREFWLKYLFKYGISQIETTEDTIANFRIHDSSKSVSIKGGFHEEYASLLIDLAEKMDLPELENLIQEKFEIGEVNQFEINGNEVNKDDIQEMIISFLLRRASVINSLKDFQFAKKIVLYVKRRKLKMEPISNQYYKEAKEHVRLKSWFLFRLIRKIKWFNIEKGTTPYWYSKQLHVIITTWAYPEINSKGNPFVEDQVIALADKKIKVAVFLYDYINVMKYFFKRLIFKKLDKYKRGDGYKLFVSRYINIFPSLLEGNFITSIQKGLILLAATYKLKRYIFFNGKPDLFHQHYIYNSSSFITHHLCVKFNIPYVITEHSPSGVNAEVKLDKFETLEQRLDFIKGAAVRIAVSEKYKKEYEKVFDCEFKVLPNMIPDLFAESSRLNNKPDDKFVFINIGTLGTVKAHKRLINAFEKNFAHRKEFQLKIIGKGPEELDLKKSVKEKGLEEQVLFLGELNRVGVMNEIDSSHVFVLSSDRETFNISLVEAMFRGLPVVSTKCGGPEGIINENNGLLSEINELDLSEKMLQLHENYSNYNFEAIAEQAKEKYSQNKIINELISLYRLAINEKGT